MYNYKPFEGNAEDLTGVTFVAASHGGVTGTVGSGGNDRYGNANNAYAFASSQNNCMMSNVPIGVSGTSARTITFWMRAGTNSNMIVPLTMAAGGSNLATGDHFGIYSGNSLQDFTAWYFGEDIEAPTATYDNEWHMYALTYTGTTGTLGALYRDGTLRASQSTGWASTPNTANGPMYLGCGPDGNVGAAGALEHFFTGEVDDVRVFSRVLCGAGSENGCASNAPNDIAALYAVSAP